MKTKDRWVLVVDDNKSIRELVSDIVSHLGFNVAQASDGAEAFALFSEHGFDLILTDFQMPVMDGLHLASRIKNDSPGTPVVLITGSVREGVEKRMEKRSVDRVVYKPFRVEQLLETITAFMGAAPCPV